MWFIDQLVCPGSKALPSPAGSVHTGHTGVSDPGAPRPAVHNHCAHIHTERIWTYIKATFPAKLQDYRSLENAQLPQKNLSLILGLFQAL